MTSGHATTQQHQRAYSTHSW